MLDKLPTRLKSGRILVATAADANAGLYRHDPEDGDEDYRIVTRAGSVSRGEEFTRAGVPHPPAGSWQWLANYKPAGRSGNSKRERIAAERREAKAQPRTSSRSANAMLQQRIGGTALEKVIPGKDVSKDASKDAPVSPIHLCADCQKDVRRDDHAHSSSDTAGYTQTVCCPCVAKRGIRCTASAQHALTHAIGKAMRESETGTVVITKAEQPKRRRSSGARRRR